jgi:hypothetical protein
MVIKQSAKVWNGLNWLRIGANNCQTSTVKFHSKAEYGSIHLYIEFGLTDAMLTRTSVDHRHYTYTFV